MGKLRNLLLVLGIALLGGCASLWGINTTKPVPVYHKPMYIDESYTINGRFSINGSHNHEYGNYIWQKNVNSEEINFHTPIGQTVAKIVIERGVVTLTTPKQTYVGNDVDDMLYDNIGFDLPIEYLHYWIQGLPIPETPLTKTIQGGFEQLGWRVEYLDWVDINHPHIIKCMNQDLIVKMLINWN